LQLQIKQELHILTLKEVVLNDKPKVVLDVVVLDPLVDGVADVPDLLIVLVQAFFHGVTLEQVLLSRFV
jgi:hypothetical protein